ncbi:hypothetical protein [Caulobacter sp. NIBR1757]|uniref:hypothetical protein n=1 Tax=Caulobacter sp. NIBR1757 TaxID=3016000 RepID=UPI0022F03180|nr:hypothetical protein [Caulobacter sp. NIBR1757]WGM37776.1 hypothetical protein AMEJIAPC_00676 [Caulobacter sp. NIBR1757]
MEEASYNSAVHDRMFLSYGLFLVVWSTFEAVLEVATMKIANMDPVHAVIVSSGLGFERKASIARSLMALDGDRYATAISLINQITQTAERNAMVHGQIRIGSESIAFVKRTTDQKLQTTVKRLSADEFAIRVATVNVLVANLQANLEITDEELEAYSKTGLNFLKKPSGSGMQPKRKP